MKHREMMKPTGEYMGKDNVLKRGIEMLKAVVGRGRKTHGETTA